MSLKDAINVLISNYDAEKTIPEIIDACDLIKILEAYNKPQGISNNKFCDCEAQPCPLHNSEARFYSQSDLDSIIKPLEESLWIRGQEEYKVRCERMEKAIRNVLISAGRIK